MVFFFVKYSKIKRQVHMLRYLGLFSLHKSFFWFFGGGGEQSQKMNGIEEKGKNRIL